ncbi:DUF4402 domain-containing protein [Sphingomonas paeninsulae]|nr:DUF4402 domain-containing protein [Sphingomonas paeninsulae]
MGAFHQYSRLRVMACALVILGCGTSLPACAGVATAKASVTTLRKLSLLNLTDLDFATNIAGTTAGTVTIDPDDDTRTNTGGTIAAGGTPQAAKFYTYGGALQNLQVNRGALPVLARVGGGATMNVTGLTLNGPVLRFLNAAGLLDLRVGATLAVGPNQLPGAYTGTFQIIVTYY